ncbi:MAG: RNA methyltransferase [Candidatus Promineifilaceae bacterium]|nr:RNA methyltransferase [Anaerolineaceae bacterium]
MATLLTSLQNPRIKNLLKLQNRRYRDAQQKTVVEGIREIGCVLHSGLLPQEAYVCPELLTDAAGTAVYQQLQALAKTAELALFTVTPELFAKAAYRGQSGGILLVIPYLSHSLASLTLPHAPLLLIIDGSEKPGNLGAILRTADAAGIDAVIVTSQPGSGTDIHNPNVVRASLGALFTLPVVEATPAELFAWLRHQQIQIAVLTPEGERPYAQTNLQGRLALVMGSEAHGVQPQWLAEADLRLKIPMFGTVDSLNLSVATAVVVFEAIRQRQKGG